LKRPYPSLLDVVMDWMIIVVLVVVVSLVFIFPTLEWLLSWFPA